MDYGNQFRAKETDRALLKTPHAQGVNVGKEHLKDVPFFGGRGWIRTTEVSDNRFTVCPIWPLWNSPVYSDKQKSLSM